MLAGTLIGSYHWIHSASLGVTTPAGTVMLATLPVLAGLQLLLAFVHYDIAAVPRRPFIWQFISRSPGLKSELGVRIIALLCVCGIAIGQVLFKLGADTLLADGGKLVSKGGGVVAAALVLLR